MFSKNQEASKSSAKGFVMARDYYVYVHRRKSDGSVFYVGKGHGYRAWATKRSAYWSKIARKHGFTVEIVENGYTEWFAHEREIQLIEQYGRENICNHTDGGEGCSNPSKEAREKIGAANRGRRRSAEHIERIIAAHKGVPRTEDVKRRISLAHKGKPKPATRGENHGGRRPVICVETGASYPTIQMAVDWLHSIGHNRATQASISCCTRGYKKSAYGFVWKYVNEQGEMKC